MPAVEEHAACGRAPRRRGKKFRLDAEAPDGEPVPRRPQLGQVVGVRRGIDQGEIGGAERGAIEPRERARPHAAGRKDAAVLDQRLAEAHERREHEAGARPADTASGEQVQLAAEPDDDERRRARERTPPARETAHGRGPPQAEAAERRRPEVATLLALGLLPERLVTLDDRVARAGERQVKQPIRTVRPDVGAEEARRHPEARSSIRGGNSSARRTASGPSPMRSSMTRTR